MTAFSDKVRIVVVGDSGVGKTSLVHLICHNEPIDNPYWTIGCSIEVKLHEYKAGTPAEKTFFVELCDVGGWSAHQNSRSIFYNPVHGVILVHDLTNRKSEVNLRKWAAEILSKEGKAAYEDFDPEQFAGSSAVPMLVIGSKQDQAEAVREQKSLTVKRSQIADECGADEINLNCKNIKHLAPGTTNAVKLGRFFDKVIERKHFSRESYKESAFVQPARRVAEERRRPTNSHPTLLNKTLHND